MIEGFLDGYRQNRDPESSVPFLEANAARLPLGRLMTSDEVARMAVVAISDLAAGLTGSTIAVDAGELAS